MKEDYSTYKKPKYKTPILEEEEKEIIEPVSRSKPKESRYASIGKPEEKEKAVVEPMEKMFKYSEELPKAEGKLGGRMKGRDKLPKVGYLNDTAFFFDQKEGEYEMGWEHRWNRRRHHWFISNASAAANGTIYSTPFYCAPYRWALILTNVTGSDAAALKIVILVEFSWDGVSFFPFMEDWWGMDMITGAMAAATYRQSIPVPILAPWIRLGYVVSGVDQTEWSNITLTGIFNSV